ncbi:MAG: hypothetical protein KDE33_11265 [Bacteroidetes bacterium]|nr:hypothetical protein [Bacteroidota bacterium]
MPTFQEIKTQAEQHRNSKNYAEALPLYQEIWENHRENCGKWEGWAYAFCKSKLGLHSEALELCREIYPNNKDFEQIKGLYAWSIYYTEIKDNEIKDEARFFKAAQAITQLTKQEDKYSPYLLVVYKVLEYLNNKAIFNPSKVIEWTDKLEKTTLDATPFSFEDKEGKTRELASKKEQYYSLRTKALFELNRSQDCIECCHEALESFSKFHYDNDIWFKRLIALSNAKLSNFEEAITQLKELLKKKNEWFIQKEIAELFLQVDNINEAEKYAIDGALNFGDADKKLNLYLLIADILQRQGKSDEARKHIEFICKIRQEKQWKIDNELQQQVTLFNIDLSKLPNFKVIQNELRRIWDNLKFSTQDQFKGLIKSILPNGKAGFVEIERGKSYYFQLKDFKGRRDLIKEGQKVIFYLEDSFDQKKNQPTKNAVNVKPIF